MQDLPQPHVDYTARQRTLSSSSSTGSHASSALPPPPPLSPAAAATLAQPPPVQTMSHILAQPLPNIAEQSSPSASPSAARTSGPTTPSAAAAAASPSPYFQFGVAPPPSSTYRVCVRVVHVAPPCERTLAMTDDCDSWCCTKCMCILVLVFLVHRYFI